MANALGYLAQAMRNRAEMMRNLSSSPEVRREIVARIMQREDVHRLIVELQQEQLMGMQMPSGGLTPPYKSKWYALKKGKTNYDLNNTGALFSAIEVEATIDETKVVYGGNAPSYAQYYPQEEFLELTPDRWAQVRAYAKQYFREELENYLRNG